MKKRTAFGLILTILFVGASALMFNVKRSKSGPATIVVPTDYPTIQEAVDAARSGDIIFVRNGTYRENITLNSEISLIGEYNKAKLDGQIQISNSESGSAQTTVKDFLIQNQRERYGVELVDSSNVLIESNIFDHCGISSHNTSNVTICSNVFDNAELAINVVHGAHFSILNNRIQNVKSAIRMSDEIAYVEAFNNVILNASYGLELEFVEFSDIHDNLVMDCDVGLSISHRSLENEIHKNTIKDNEIGISVLGASNNIFYHNDFIRNEIQSETQIHVTEPQNTWDYDYPFGGNYWSDYTGADEFSGRDQDVPGSDGIIDDRYVIDENNIDRYPLLSFAALRSFDVTWGLPPGLSFVTVSCDGSVRSYSFNKAKKQLSFIIAITDSGLCEVSVPRNRLDAPFTLTVDSVAVEYVLGHNETHTTLSFTADIGLHDIQIDGTRRGYIMGDINEDGQVTIVDIAIVALNHGHKEKDYP